MNKKTFAIAMLGVAVAGMASAVPVSFSDSLQGYVNDTSADDAFLGPNLEAASTGGASSIVFDATGASFGTADGGWGGRNYIRTTGTDYGTQDFTAFVTLDRLAGQDLAWIGLGGGDARFFREPDGADGGQPANPSAFFQLTDFGWAGYDTYRVSTITAAGGPTEQAWGRLGGVSNGLYRIKLDYDVSAATITVDVDTEYDGTFVSDKTQELTVTNQAAAFNGGGALSRIYFGGGEGLTYSDFSVTVIPEPGTMGLLVAMGGGLLFMRRRLKR